MAEFDPQQVSQQLSDDALRNSAARMRAVGLPPNAAPPMPPVSAVSAADTRKAMRENAPLPEPTPVTQQPAPPKPVTVAGPTPASVTPAPPAATPSAPPAPAPNPEDRMVSRAQKNVEDIENKPSGIARLIPLTEGDSFGKRLLRGVEHVGRGIATGAEVAGDIVAPRVMGDIPGTNMYRAVHLNQAEQQLSGAEKNRTEAAQAEEARGKAATARNGEWAEVTGGAIDPAHPELGQQQAFYNKANPTQRDYAGPMKPDTAHAPLASAEVDNANKGFLDRFKVLNPEATALPAQYVLPPNATKEQRDFVDKQLEQVEKSTGTKAQNDITEKMRKDAAAEHQREYDQKQDEQLINWKDKSGNLVSGTRGEAKAAGVDPKDMHGPTNPALQEKSRQAYTQYGRIIDNAQTAANTMTAWDENTPQGKINRQAAMDVAKTYWDHVGGSVGVAGAAVSPEYLQQAINSDAYRKMDAAGREHMQNMFQLWSDAVNIVKQETGGVPRGQEILKKEDAILPKPDKTMEMNEKALVNLAKRIRTDAKEYARPSDMDPLSGGVIPASATHTLQDKSGKTVGYVDAKGKDQLF